MITAMNAIREFCQDEEGPTAIEYAVLVTFIIVAAITGVLSFGNAVMGLFDDASKAKF